MRYVLLLPNYRPPLLNQLMRGHMRQRMRLERECRQLVGGHALEQGVPIATGPRRVHLTITLGPRMRPSDADSPWKALLDALVAARLLLNDTAAFCQLGDLRFVRGPEAATRVELEDLEEQS